MPVLTKINRSSLAAGVVGTTELSDNAVTSAKAIALDTADITTGTFATTMLAGGAVTGAKIGYLGDGGSSGNLSGTIANQQLHFGTAFTLTDNLTVNGNLTLAKVRDDGTGQSLTGSGRTLSGTGTLTMGGSIEGNRPGRDDTVPVTSVNGMTGTLGVDVFPAGHVIQTKSVSVSTIVSQASSEVTVAKVWGDLTGLSLDITPTAGNKVLVFCSLNLSCSAADFLMQIRILRESENIVGGSTAISVGTDTSGSVVNARNPASGMAFIRHNAIAESVNISYLDTPSVGKNTYKVQWHGETGQTFYLNRGGADSDASNFGRYASNITVMEIVV